MSDQNSQDGSGGEVDPGTETPAVGLTRDEAKAMFAEELENQRRHFQGIAARDSNKYKQENRAMRQQVAAQEAQLSQMQQQYLGSLEGDQKVQYLMTQLQQQNHVPQNNYAPAEYNDTISFKDVLAEMLRAQGVDPNSADIDWAANEHDVLAAAQRVGKSAAKVTENSLTKKVEAEVAKLKADLAKLVENEYEVGDKSKVDTGGGRAGKVNAKVTRKDLDDMDAETYLKLREEGAFG